MNRLLVMYNTLQIPHNRQYRREMVNIFKKKRKCRRYFFFFFLLVHIYLRLHLNLACICAPDFSRARAHEIKREIARKGHSTSKSISYEITFGSIYGFTCELRTNYESMRIYVSICVYVCANIWMKRALLVGRWRNINGHSPFRLNSLKRLWIQDEAKSNQIYFIFLLSSRTYMCVIYKCACLPVCVYIFFLYLVARGSREKGKEFYNWTPRATLFFFLFYSRSVSKFSRPAIRKS